MYEEAVLKRVSQCTVDVFPSKMLLAQFYVILPKSSIICFKDNDECVPIIAFTIPFTLSRI